MSCWTYHLIERYIPKSNFWNILGSEFRYPKIYSNLVWLSACSRYQFYLWQPYFLFSNNPLFNFSIKSSVTWGLGVLPILRALQFNHKKNMNITNIEITFCWKIVVNLTAPISCLQIVPTRFRLLQQGPNWFSWSQLVPTGFKLVQLFRPIWSQLVPPPSCSWFSSSESEKGYSVSVSYWEVVLLDENGNCSLISKCNVWTAIFH